MINCFDHLLRIIKARNFYKWQYIIKEQISIQSFDENSENIEDEKENNIGIELFNEEISKSEDQFGQILDQSHQGIHDMEMKIKIKSVCQELMHEIIARYLKCKNKI